MMPSVSLRHVSEQTLLSFFQAEFPGSPAPDTLPSTDFNCCSAPEVLNQSSPPPPHSSLGQARFTGMSQHQYHCPASPMPAAPALLPLGQPQSGYSIPCGAGILPSESASQPIRSSALPAGSATPYTTTTGYILFLLLFVFIDEI